MATYPNYSDNQFPPEKHDQPFEPPHDAKEDVVEAAPLEVSPAQELATQYRNHASSHQEEDPEAQQRAKDDEGHFVGGFAAERGISDDDEQGFEHHLDDSIHDRPGWDASDASLVNNASKPGRSSKYEDLEYSDPYNDDRALPIQEKATGPFRQFMNAGKYPMEQRIEDKKRGIGRQKYPVIVWALTVVMVSVFIKEIVLNWQQQGTPVSFHPVVNPMLGPSESALINLGARFPPCMKTVVGLASDTQFACMNDTANPPNQLCSIEEVCGFGGFHDEAPNQWFRFIVPIFLHAGFVHIALNMLAQLTVSAQIEREMGSAGFIITYMAAGIFGNVLGGNFSLVGAPSLGASGAIFGTVSVTWVDLFAHWKYHYRPVRRLVLMSIELVIGIAIGYIPFVDNFAHIGGFAMGLFVGTTFYPVISTTKRHKAIVWGFRITAIPIAIILFVVLIRNFYTSDPYAACSGCRYLSCFPTKTNDYCKGNGFTTFNTTSTTTSLR